MGNIGTKLRIGEKIGIGFGVVGLLFLGVIWQLDSLLNRSLNDYKQLQNVQVASKDRILAVESELMRARIAEQLFLMDRDFHQAQLVKEHISAAQRETGSLARIDAQAAETSEEIGAYLQSYLEHFQNVEAAWIRNGVDENSGLQGSFREAVHNLEDMAGHLNTDALYLNLLQIRRSEKDLGLRREGQYQQRVYELIGEFTAHIEGSELSPNVKERLLVEISEYKEEFSIYAEKVLEGGDLQGGKGPYSDAARHIESLINRYYVPDMERDILQLRRREKDYLLRADEQYVEMVIKQVEAIEQRIELSGISDEHRTEFKTLLHRYRDDFLLLVEQSNEISQLTEQMELAANQVIETVRTSVQGANSKMDEVIHNIDVISKQRTNWMLWIVGMATLLGIFFAIGITRHIVNPMRKMTVLLEELTYTELVDPIHHVPGGRDEVNEMAGYLNTLVEYRNRFIKWWERSMDEAVAYEQMKDLIEESAKGDSDSGEELENLKRDLYEALSSKKLLISDELAEIKAHADEILHASTVLQRPSASRGDIDEQGSKIHYSAEMIGKSLTMLSAETVKETSS